MATESSLVRVFRGRIDDAKERHELSLRLPVADAEYLANELTELEAKLAALDWTPITESNPVRLADEVLDSGSICLALVIPENLTTDWTGYGFDYRRPLNPPVQP